MVQVTFTKNGVVVSGAGSLNVRPVAGGLEITETESGSAALATRPASTGGAKRGRKSNAEKAASTGKNSENQTGITFDPEKMPAA
jgi:hypothetical protein